MRTFPLVKRALLLYHVQMVTKMCRMHSKKYREICQGNGLHKNAIGPLNKRLPSELIKTTATGFLVGFLASIYLSSTSLAADSPSQNLPVTTLAKVLESPFEDGMKVEGLLPADSTILEFRAKQFANPKTRALALRDCANAKIIDHEFFCKFLEGYAKELADDERKKKSSAKKFTKRKDLMASIISLFGRGHGRDGKKHIFDPSKNIDAQWKEFNRLNNSELISLLKEVKSWDQLQWLAVKTLSNHDCNGPGLPMALAQKAEEFFPDSYLVGTAIELYQKTVSCSANTALFNENTMSLMTRARFRLGMILTWQNRYEEALPHLRWVESQGDSYLSPRAAYWSYRCAKNLKQNREANQIAEKIMQKQPLSWHQILLIEDPKIKEGEFIVKAEQPVQLRTGRPELDRLIRVVEIFHRAGVTQLTTKITTKLLKDQTIVEKNPLMSLYLLAMKLREGDYLKVFNGTLGLLREAKVALSVSVLKLLYPKPWDSIVATQAQGLDPLLVTALMRQESTFNHRARSRAGARGLMQLMPATAKRFDRNSPKKLEDPTTNIRVGSQYLQFLLARFQGNIELTLASYNAGELRVDEWLRRYPTEDRALFFELIPFTETREYVSIIVRNYFWYQWLANVDEKSALAAGTLSERKIASNYEAKLNALYSTAFLNSEKIIVTP